MISNGIRPMLIKLQARAERLDALVQAAPHLAQLLADRDLLIEEFLQLGLLLGRQDHLVFLALPLCSSVSLRSVSLSCCCSSRSLPRKLSSAARRMSSTVVNGRCDVARPRIEIRSDEPLEIVDRVDDEIAVVCERVHDLLAEERLHLHPEPIAEHVGIGDEDDFAGVLGSARWPASLRSGNAVVNLPSQTPGDDERLLAVGFVADQQLARIAAGT